MFLPDLEVNPYSRITLIDVDRKSKNNLRFYTSTDRRNWQ